jgi:hypothetical protein
MLNLLNPLIFNAIGLLWVMLCTCLMTFGAGYCAYIGFRVMWRAGHVVHVEDDGHNEVRVKVLRVTWGEKSNPRSVDVRA